MKRLLVVVLTTIACAGCGAFNEDQRSEQKPSKESSYNGPRFKNPTSPSGKEVRFYGDLYNTPDKVRAVVERIKPGNKGFGTLKISCKPELESFKAIGFESFTYRGTTICQMQSVHDDGSQDGVFVDFSGSTASVFTHRAQAVIVHFSPVPYGNDVYRDDEVAENFRFSVDSGIRADELDFDQPSDISGFTYCLRPVG